MIRIVSKGAREVARNMRRAREEMDRQNMMSARAGGHIVQRAIVIRLSGNPLRRRSGKAAQSVRVGQPRKVGRAWSIAIGSPGLEGRILAAHEEGMTITPKSKRFLAVPLPGSPAMTASGVPRGNPRDFPNTHVIRTKSGKLLIVQDRSARGPRGRGVSIFHGPSHGVARNVVPLFILVRSVRLPDRHAFRKAYSDCQDDVVRVFGAGVRAVVRVGNGA